MAGRRRAERSAVYGRAVAGMVSVMALLVLNFSDSIKIYLPSLLLMQSSPRITTGFVSTKGSHFVDGGAAAASGGGGRGGTPLYINGWNSYWLMH